MIDILIRSDSRYPLNRKNIRRRLEEHLTESKIKTNVEVSVFIVGSRKMKTLNKQYRQLDKLTNVLSFPLGETRGVQIGFAYPDDGKLYLGDIVICYPEARHQAAEYQLFVGEWIGDLAVHGLEHLLGRHHE